MVNRGVTDFFYHENGNNWLISVVRNQNMGYGVWGKRNSKRLTSQQQVLPAIASAKDGN